MINPKKNCLVCGENIHMRTVGHSIIFNLCWKHDVEARRLYKDRYHLDGKAVKREILNIVEDQKLKRGRNKPKRS